MRVIWMFEHPQCEKCSRKQPFLTSEHLRRFVSDIVSSPQEEIRRKRIIDVAAEMLGRSLVQVRWAERAIFDCHREH